MTNADDPEPILEWTGERYVPEVSGNIRLEHLHRYLLARELSRGRRILDIACGEGYGSGMLSEVASAVVGIDIVPQVVEHARRRYQRPNLSFAAGSCTAIPLTDQSIDVVVCFETLEHHDQHDAMISELRRVLRPDGLIVISSPNRTEYSEIPGYENPFHVRELDQGEFVALLRSQFTNTHLIGQRIRAGSVVGPVDSDENTSFLSFEDRRASEDHDGTPSRLAGLTTPLYLIGVASNAQLPRIPVGIFDGGQFVWAIDHRAAVASAREQTEAASWDQTHAFLEGQLDQERARGVSLEAQVTVAERHLRVAGEQLADATSSLESERARVSELRMALKAAEAQSALAQEQRAAALAIEAHLRSERDALFAEVRLMEESHSWSVTRPLRAIRRYTDRGFAGARRITSDVTRAVYRGLPIEHGTKRAIKGAVFRAAPWLVRHTTAYGAWQRQLAPASAPEPVAAAAEPEGHIGVDVIPIAPTAASAAVPVRRFDEHAIRYEPFALQSVDTRIKAIAFYLPQFHPIPENDSWWGKGFTEWHNVSRGRPRFPGHYQPHMPGELGFYDLRLLDVQRRQIELARAYGLHGFCYHHYWFGGKRLLRRPLDQLLDNPDLDFPFCLCWANENWTRRWDGLDHEVLIAQEHSADDDLAFIRDIEPALGDRRYISINGRPLLIVYRPGLLPDPSATVARWRTYRRAAGLPDLFLVSAQGFDRRDPRDWGFDAAVEFAPNNMPVPRINGEVAGIDPHFEGTIFAYGDLVATSRSYQSPDGYPLFRAVAPMWDNEARRQGRGTVFAGSTPALYQEWLENACRHTDEHMGPDKPFVFINAWNEWAEGAHLEPDRAHGYAYLRATANALRQFPATDEQPTVVIVSHDAYFHGAQRLALRLAGELKDELGYKVEIILRGPGPLTPEFERVGRVHDFSPATSTPEGRLRIAQDLRQRGARLALCNTSVVGDIVEVLRTVGFKIVSMIHELPGLISHYGLQPSVASIAEHADRVVFPARVVRDHFMELTGMPPEKGVVRPQGLLRPNRLGDNRELARHDIRTTLGVPSDAAVALGLGFADRRKGIDLFVETGLLVIAQRPDTHFVWVGHHDAEAFDQARRRIAEAGCESAFHFPGLVEAPDAFFAGADVFLLTSREDPFPLVVLDALDAALPIVAFKGGGGFVELLERDCGFLVPYLDVEAMAEAVVEILEDPSEGRRLGAVGKAIIASEFSFRSYARELVELAQGPRVSVIVPNYNYAHHLPARLRSILSQTYRPHEIIFLDDCSTDDSIPVARSILESSPVPFKIISNQSNQGVYRQWLRGLSEASGDLVWIAEADDDCSPLLLEQLVPTFAEPGVTLAYCQSKQIDVNGRELASDYLAWTADVDAAKWNRAFIRRGVDEVRDSLAIKNTIPNVSAVLMRRPDLRAIETQLLSLRNAGDWFVYVHLLEAGDVAFIPEVLNYHRRHAGSVTIGQGGLNLMRETMVVQRYIEDRHELPPEVQGKRDAHLQSTYEYLGLHRDGPASYVDHESLREATLEG